VLLVGRRIERERRVGEVRWWEAVQVRAEQLDAATEHTDGIDLCCE